MTSLIEFSNIPAWPRTELMEYYSGWPFAISIEDHGPQLYRRILRCAELDKPAWIKNGKPYFIGKHICVGNQKLPLRRHFEPQEYSQALRFLEMEHADKPYFARLRQGEFNSRCLPTSENGFVSEKLAPGVSIVEF